MNTKTRKANRVWKRFASLDRGQYFDLGGKTTYAKDGFLRACSLTRTGEVARYFFPWTKVRTFELVRKTPLKTASATLAELDSIVEIANQTVGTSEGSCYRDTDCNQPRVDQPHNDKESYGPTA